MVEPKKQAENGKPSLFKMNFADFTNPLADPVPPQFKTQTQSQVIQEQSSQGTNDEKNEPQLKQIRKTHSKFYIPGKTPG